MACKLDQVKKQTNKKQEEVSYCENNDKKCQFFSNEIYQYELVEMTKFELII